MAISKAFSFEALLLFFSRAFLRITRRNPRSSLHRKVSNGHTSNFKMQKYHHSLTLGSDLSNQTLVFDVEGALLRSSSLFPYFMIVAFEAGGLLRALVLFLLYPFVCLVNEEMGLKIMVMVCFFGIKRESFRVGRAVLPKFFLEDIGVEGFEVVMRGGRKVGVSDLPLVMVEGFLRDYLKVESIVGRELKIVCGYYVGLMEDKKKVCLDLEEILGERKVDSDVIGIGSFNKSLDHQLFSHCKEIYFVSGADRRTWHSLPKEMYPKPLIFHDGRLAFKPNPSATLVMFMWVPFGLFIAIIRAILALTLLTKISLPILAFSGMRLRLSKPKSSLHNSTINLGKQKGLLYVCNHKTLLDPLYLSTALNNNLAAVTYSLSRITELLTPIRSIRLTRDREQDGKIMEKLLSEGDLVVCPEGTTCREPYLLRFSPLFAEMSDEIVPVAMDAHVSMFYGTTAGGLKCLDPLLFLMNPFPIYNVKLLEKISTSSKCQDGGESRFHVANLIQSELGKALGFECTRLTRKDKYLILAGNEGIVKG